MKSRIFKNDIELPTDTHVKIGPKGWAPKIQTDLHSLQVMAQVFQFTGQKLPRSTRILARNIFKKKETFSDRLKVHIRTAGGGQAILKSAWDRIVEAAGGNAADLNPVSPELQECIA